ncbi:hypothetical protein HDU67_005335 [Dinochytrium kinnereticum]|nr:hypothetical protein HDU67_005335 [Dinochytrium kinnereticum]
MADPKVDKVRLRIRLHQTTSMDVEVAGDDDRQTFKFEELATATLRFKVAVSGSTTVPELLKIVRRQFDAMVAVRQRVRDEGGVVGDRVTIVEESQYINHAIIRDVDGDQILPPFTVSDFFSDNDLLHVIVPIPLQVYARYVSLPPITEDEIDDLAEDMERTEEAPPAAQEEKHEKPKKLVKRKRRRESSTEDSRTEAVVPEPENEEAMASESMSGMNVTPVKKKKRKKASLVETEVPPSSPLRVTAGEDESGIFLQQEAVLLTKKKDASKTLPSTIVREIKTKINGASPEKKTKESVPALVSKESKTAIEVPAGKEKKKRAKRASTANDVIAAQQESSVSNMIEASEKNYDGVTLRNGKKRKFSENEADISDDDKAMVSFTEDKAPKRKRTRKRVSDSADDRYKSDGREAKVTADLDGSSNRDVPKVLAKQEIEEQLEESIHKPSTAAPDKISTVSSFTLITQPPEVLNVGLGDSVKGGVIVQRKGSFASIVSFKEDETLVDDDEGKAPLPKNRKPRDSTLVEEKKAPVTYVDGNSYEETKEDEDATLDITNQTSEMESDKDDDSGENKNGDNTVASEVHEEVAHLEDEMVVNDSAESSDSEESDHHGISPRATQSSPMKYPHSQYRAYQAEDDENEDEVKDAKDCENDLGITKELATEAYQEIFVKEVSPLSDGVLSPNLFSMPGSLGTPLFSQISPTLRPVDAEEVEEASKTEGDIDGDASEELDEAESSTDLSSNAIISKIPLSSQINSSQSTIPNSPLTTKSTLKKPTSSQPVGIIVRPGSQLKTFTRPSLSLGELANSFAPSSSTNRRVPGVPQTLASLAMRNGKSSGGMPTAPPSRDDEDDDEDEIMAKVYGRDEEEDDDDDDDDDDEDEDEDEAAGGIRRAGRRKRKSGLLQMSKRG